MGMVIYIVTYPEDTTIGTGYRDVIKDDVLSDFAERLSEIGQVRLKLLDM